MHGVGSAARRTATLLVATVGAVLWSVVGAPVAAAHTELLGSDPPDGTVVGAAPERISLTFTEELLELETIVIVTGPDGAPYQVGAPVLDGATVTVELADLSVPGAYAVAYRVVSADGHPVEGQIGFSVPAAAVAAAAPPAPPSPAAPPASPSPATAAPPTTSAATGAQAASTTVPPSTTGAPTSSTSAPSSTSADVVTTSSSGDTTGWLWIAIAVAAALVATVAVVILRRQRGAAS